MRLRTLFFAAFVATGTLLSGQSMMGVKGGFSLSNIANGQANSSTNATTGTNYKPSFHAGVYYQVEASSYFDFRAEALFAVKGFATGTRSVGNRIVGNLNYFNVPILGIYKPVTGVDIEFGGEFGYLINAKQRGTQLTNGVSTPIDTDISAFYRKFDFGLVGGVGYNADNGIAVSIRLVFGVFNINNRDDTSNNTIGSTAIQQNRVTHIGVHIPLVKSD